MTNFSQREHNLKNALKRLTNREFLPAIVGDPFGKIYDPNRPGNVFVQVQTGQGLSPQVISVIGPTEQTIQLKPMTPVQLEWDKKKRLFIARLDPDAMVAMQVNPVAYTQRTLSPRLSQDNLETLWCFQSNPPSTVVNVKAWVPIINNTVYLFPGGKIDLGPSGANVLPAVGYQAWIVVFVKNDYLTLEAKTSTAVPLNDVLDTRSAIQQCLDAKTEGSTPSWSMLLQDNPSSVDQNTINKGIDLRNMVNSSEGGGTSVINLIMTDDDGNPMADDDGNLMLGDF